MECHIRGCRNLETKCTDCGRVVYNKTFDLEDNEPVYLITPKRVIKLDQVDEILDLLEEQFDINIGEKTDET